MNQAVSRLAPLAPPYSPELNALLTKLTPPGAPDILALFRASWRTTRR
jgi:4-carboxymuconolactone decarboxylase